MVPRSPSGKVVLLLEKEGLMECVCITCVNECEYILVCEGMCEHMCVGLCIPFTVIPFHLQFNLFSFSLPFVSLLPRYTKTSNHKYFLSEEALFAFPSQVYATKSSQ